MRKGMMVGRGKGYYNYKPMFSHDRKVHQMSGKGMKQPQQLPTFMYKEGRGYPRSRAQRLDWVMGYTEEYIDYLNENIELMQSELDKKKPNYKQLRKIAKTIKPYDDTRNSEINNLTEEMESWQSNLEGTNLENTMKYQIISDAVDSLENVDLPEEAPKIPTRNKREAWEEYLMEIDSYKDELQNSKDYMEGIEFPSMYG